MTYRLVSRGAILDHWEMRSIRNQGEAEVTETRILDHWEMRSIRNPTLEHYALG